MTDVRRVKQMLVVVIGLVVAVVGLVVLRQLADVVLRASTGADPASIFNEPIQAPAELLEIIEWLPDPPREGRSMEPTSRVRITESFAQAWSSLDRSSRGDDEAPIDVYFSGPALEAVLDARDRGSGSSLVQIEHLLELQFYSDDGQVVSLESQARMVRIIGEDDGRVVLPTTERFAVVMVLEDGNWRVQQLTVAPDSVAPTTTDPEPGAPAPATPVPTAPEVDPIVGAVAALTTSPMRGANTVTIDGEDRTWRTATPSTVEADLDLLNELGLDTLRVFVSGPEFAPADLDGVLLALDGAAERGQRVVVTLFDGSADHHPSRWGAMPTYLEQVVGTLGGHPAIALWDLKNEPDRDDERSGGADLVDAWLGEVVDEVRRLDPATPITIGWSTAEHAGRLADQVDIVSFHHFGSASELRDDVRRLRSELGERPILLSEFGTATWRGVLRGEQGTMRARHLRELIRVAEEEQLAGWLVWVLRDPILPPDVGGGTWARRAELSHGLLRSDGTARDASVAVVASRGEADPGSPPIGERVRGAAPIAIVVGAVALMLTGAVLAVRRLAPGRGNRIGRRRSGS